MIRVATAGPHVEGVVSPCAVCEDTGLKTQELDTERCRLELEKLKCEIEICKRAGADKPDEKSDDKLDDKPGGKRPDGARPKPDDGRKKAGVA